MVERDRGKPSGSWVWVFAGLSACGTASPASQRPSLAAAVPAGVGTATSAPSELKRECASTSDCEIAWLLLDCCGSAQAVGVSKGTREAAEEAARARFGGSCECLAAATRLDSGQTADAPSDVVVTCEARACATRLAESAGSI